MALNELAAIGATSVNGGAAAWANDRRPLRHYDGGGLLRLNDNRSLMLVASTRSETDAEN